MLNLIIGQSSNLIYTCNLHFQQMIAYLTTLPQFKLYDPQLLIHLTKDQMAQKLRSQLGKLPDYIIFYERLNLQLAFPDECRLVLIVDDLHHQGAAGRKRRAELCKVDRVLSTYAYCFNKYYHTTAKIYFFPHSSSYIRPFNEQPMEQICVSGRLNAQTYPVRQNLYEMCKKDNRLIYLPVNCNYVMTTTNDNHIYGSRYVHTLGNYLASFTCDLNENRPYMVAKNFEILASGSLLLSHNVHTLPYFSKLGLLAGVHYLAVHQNNLQDTITWVLDPTNRIAVDKIRRAGYDFVSLYHTPLNRAHYLMDILGDKNVILQNDGLAHTAYYIQDIYAK